MLIFQILFAEPPGPVQNLVMISKTSTTVGIRWQRPSITGGRSDYYYSIEHSDPRGSASSTISVTNRLEDTAATITYTIENLLPFETYEISVITHNGVSDQVSDTISSRTISITIETSEGCKCSQKKTFILSEFYVVVLVDVFILFLLLILNVV